MAVVGITDSLRILLAQVDASQADIVLLEWQITLEEMTTLLSKIHHLTRSPKVVYFSSNEEEKSQIKTAGADYVILKNAPPDELVPIVNRIDLQSTKM